MMPWGLMKPDQRSVTSWWFRTEHGPVTTHVGDRNDIRFLPGGKILFTDINGLRYYVPNLHALDEHSQIMLETES